MPNQRVIAAELGLTQATVSMALRNDPSISAATRKLVHETAVRMGYKPNAYVSSLMARIRAGRPIPDKGCIGVLYGCEKDSDWKASQTFRMQFEGIAEKASDLGFHVEPFCFEAKEMSLSRIEKILYARGINGLILPSYYGDDARGGEQHTDIRWDRYSAAAIAYDWELPWIDRVATHHRHNVETTFRQVMKRGYRRIGMCFPPEGWTGVDSSWRAGFYLAQSSLPRPLRLPPFIGKPGITPTQHFKDWLDKCQPEVIVCLIGHEMEYLNELGIRVPEDIAMVCVNRPLDSDFSGVEENHRYVGATVAELVISGILRNDYGPPPHPKIILIEGTWVDGRTLPYRNA
jgi:LacI family transcriptional regulator